MLLPKRQSVALNVMPVVFRAVSTPRWTDPDYFIAYRGESVENAFALLQHPDISLDDAIVNDSGDVYLLYPFEIFCVSDSSVGLFQTTERKLSPNKKYLAIENNNSTSCPNNGFEYFIYSFNDEQCYKISVSEDVFVSRYNTFSNYIIGDNGQFVMCDGPIPGVGTELLKYADFAEPFFTTAFTFYKDMHAGPGQIVFSEDSISGGDFVITE